MKTKTIMKNLINFLKDPVIRMHIIGMSLLVVGLFTMAIALPKDVDVMTKIYLIAGLIIAIIGWWFTRKAESIIIITLYLGYKIFECRIKRGETLTDEELFRYNTMKDDKTMKYIDKVVEDNIIYEMEND